MILLPAVKLYLNSYCGILTLIGFYSSFSFDMDGQNVSVVEYFLKTYSYRINFQGLPAVESGSKEKKVYLPMEVLLVRWDMERPYFSGTI